MPRWCSCTWAWVQAERGGALEGADVVVLVDKIEDLLARGGDHGPEIDRAPSRPARSARRRRRAKIGSSTVPVAPESGRPPIDRRGRRANAAAAPEEPRAIGLELALADGLAVDHRQVRGPDLRLGRRAPPPRRQYRAQAGQMLGLDEQFGERRVRDVGGLRRQRQLGVGGYFDLARLIAEVRDRHAAHLRVVLGRNQHLQGGRQASRPDA